MTKALPCTTECHEISWYRLGTIIISTFFCILILTSDVANVDVYACTSKHAAYLAQQPPQLTSPSSTEFLVGPFLLTQPDPSDF